MEQRLLAEFIGTAMLLIGVVGSGIMAQNLSGGNDALALLANAIATGAMLYVIITTLGPFRVRISILPSHWHSPCAVNIQRPNCCPMYWYKSQAVLSVCG